MIEEKAKWSHRGGGALFHLVGIRMRKKRENISWEKCHLSRVLKDKDQTRTEGERKGQANKLRKAHTCETLWRAQPGMTRAQNV